MDLLQEISKTFLNSSLDQFLLIPQQQQQIFQDIREILQQIDVILLVKEVYPSN
jgi:hypothetical protein